VKIPYVITSNGITYFDPDAGEVVVSRTHPNFDLIRHCLVTGDDTTKLASYHSFSENDLTTASVQAEIRRLQEAVDDCKWLIDEIEWEIESSQALTQPPEGLFPLDARRSFLLVQLQKVENELSEKMAKIT
jgi:hypothetical protein